MRVRDPQGEKYRVGRRWLPWRRRIKGFADLWDLGPAGLGDDPISTVIAAVLAVPLIIVLVLWFGELLLLLLLLPLVMLARALFGHPWVIEVKHRGTVEHSEAVKGWAESGARRDELAELIQRGVTPTTAGQHAAPPPQQDPGAYGVPPPPGAGPPAT